VQCLYWYNISSVRNSITCYERITLCMAPMIHWYVQASRKYLPILVWMVRVGYFYSEHIYKQYLVNYYYSNNIFFSCGLCDSMFLLLRLCHIFVLEFNWFYASIKTNTPTWLYMIHCMLMAMYKCTLDFKQI